VIPTIISQALTSSHIKLGSLDPVRDLTFVEDTVRGFLLAGENKTVIGQTLNLGSGQAVSIGDLARQILSIIGRDVAIQTDPRRIRPEGSEVMRLISDASLAKKALGWEPIVSLDDGLRRTIGWVKDHLDRYKAEIYNL
jgi:dTDP-glucose 4,6-dehydratase